MRNVSKKDIFRMGHLDYPTDADEVQCYQDSTALWMHGLAARGGGNVFSLDRVSRGQRIQLHVRPYLAPLSTFIRDRGLLRGQENVLMGGKEIEGNILETWGELARIGCCCWW